MCQFFRGKNLGGDEVGPTCQVFGMVVVFPIMEEIEANVHQDRPRGKINKVCVGGGDGETDRKSASSEIEEAGGGIGESDRKTELAL